MQFNNKYQARKIQTKILFFVIILRNYVRIHNPAILVAQYIFFISRGVIKNILNNRNVIYFPKYLDVNPSQIKLCTIKEKGVFNISRYCENVESLILRNFEDDITMIQLKKILSEGMSWRSLNFFKIAKNKYRENCSIKNRANLMVALLRINTLKKLIEDVKSYKPILNNIFLWRVRGMDEIGVDLGIKNIYFNRGGTHRLAIAKIIGVKKIKVCVCRIDVKTQIKF